jgi:hypothetical protein
VVPLHLRPTATACVSLCWLTYLSATTNDEARQGKLAEGEARLAEVHGYLFYYQNIPSPTSPTSTTSTTSTTYFNCLPFSQLGGTPPGVLLGAGGARGGAEGGGAQGGGAEGGGGAECGRAEAAAGTEPTAPNANAAP